MPVRVPVDGHTVDDAASDSRNWVREVVLRNWDGLGVIRLDQLYAPLHRELVPRVPFPDVVGVLVFLSSGYTLSDRWLWTWLPLVLVTEPHCCWLHVHLAGLTSVVVASFAGGLPDGWLHRVHLERFLSFTLLRTVSRLAGYTLAVSPTWFTSCS